MSERKAESQLAPARNAAIGPAQRVTFVGSTDNPVAARLDLPSGPIRSYALFAHCFTCSKDIFAAHRIASELALRGIAVLRFDFTGLGASGGDFANTNFSSNVEDLRRAAAYLSEHHRPAELLIGHSLGGAAVLVAAGNLPDVKAVVTIAAPADAEHVIKSFRLRVPEIESAGEAVVELAGRRFTIKRQFLDDVRAQDVRLRIRNLGRPLLILHSPLDDVVGVDNARIIFDAARHPKSFVSLDSAAHLLTRREDAVDVADVVSTWCARYLAPPAIVSETADVRVSATGRGRFQQEIQVGVHRLLADEPESDGGLGSGPSPYDLLAASLGSCTAMTLQLYAERKGWELPYFVVDVRHGKVHADDCVTCVEGGAGMVDRFERTLRFDSDPGAEVLGKIVEIASKCPVHRTLESRSTIITAVGDLQD